MIVTIDTNDNLYEFYKKGIIQALYRKGNPPAIYFRYYEVFLEYRKTNNKTNSVKLTADECGVEEKTIWRCLKYFTDSN